jgi:hypothetical protein
MVMESRKERATDHALRERGHTDMERKIDGVCVCKQSRVSSTDADTRRG